MTHLNVELAYKRMHEVDIGTYLRGGAAHVFLKCPQPAQGCYWSMRTFIYLLLCCQCKLTHGSLSHAFAATIHVHACSATTLLAARRYKHEVPTDSLYLTYIFERSVRTPRHG